MSIHYRVEGNDILVFGRTFPFKDTFKSLGGKYLFTTKEWTLPYSAISLQQLELLCQSVGGGAHGHVAPASGLVMSRTEERPDMRVSELLNWVHEHITAHFSAPIWIVGEIQNLSRRARGLYFQLAERKGDAHQSATVSLSCVLWQDSLTEIQKRRGESVDGCLAEDLQVRCLARVGFYRDRGQISLQVIDLDPTYTRGALAIAREALLKEIRAARLDEHQRQLPVPRFPFRIGLVTASDSRAYSDFVHQLTSSGFPGSILFHPAPMQGDDTPQAVASAIANLAARQVDLIVLTRGGGSASDLRWFDSREIAMAICQCPVPVLAAIGHHDDICVAEQVAFQRQKTPTAAADAVILLFSKTAERIAELAQKIVVVSSRAVSHADQMAAVWYERLVLSGDRLVGQASIKLNQVKTALEHRFDQHLQVTNHRLDRTRGALNLAALNLITSNEERLLRIEKKVSNADPLPWLKSGWTKLSVGGSPVRSVAQVSEGCRAEARLLDGILQLQVVEILSAERER